MADTISTYNSTLKRLWNGEIDFENIKCMLLSDDAAFDATDATLGDVTNSGAYELDGNGWTAGGETLASVAVTVVNTSGAMLDAADISVVAMGGPIPSGGSAYKAVIYDDTDADDAPLFFISFDSPRQAGEGTNFLISWNANGIARNNWT